jgi:hypothetical protein
MLPRRTSARRTRRSRQATDGSPIEGKDKRKDEGKDRAEDKDKDKVKVKDKVKAEARAEARAEVPRTAVRKPALQAPATASSRA